MADKTNGELFVTRKPVPQDETDAFIERTKGSKHIVTIGDATYTTRNRYREKLEAKINAELEAKKKIEEKEPPVLDYGIESELKQKIESCKDSLEFAKENLEQANKIYENLCQNISLNDDVKEIIEEKIEKLTQSLMKENEEFAFVLNKYESNDEIKERKNQRKEFNSLAKRLGDIEEEATNIITNLNTLDDFAQSLKDEQRKTYKTLKDIDDSIDGLLKCDLKKCAKTITQEIAKRGEAVQDELIEVKQKYKELINIYAINLADNNAMQIRNDLRKEFVEDMKKLVEKLELIMLEIYEIEENYNKEKQGQFLEIMINDNEYQAYLEQRRQKIRKTFNNTLMVSLKTNKPIAPKETIKEKQPEVIDNPQKDEPIHTEEKKEIVLCKRSEALTKKIAEKMCGSEIKEALNSVYEILKNSYSQEEIQILENGNKEEFIQLINKKREELLKDKSFIEAIRLKQLVLKLGNILKKDFECLYCEYIGKINANSLAIIENELLKYAPKLNTKEEEIFKSHLKNQNKSILLVKDNSIPDDIKVSILKNFWKDFDAIAKTTYSDEVVEIFESKKLQERKLKAVNSIDWLNI